MPYSPIAALVNFNKTASLRCMPTWQLPAAVLLTLCFISTIALAQNVYVSVGSGVDAGNNCTNPASPCATINHAINEAEANAVVHIANGVYTENVIVTKNITVQGEDRNNTILQAHATPWHAGAGGVIHVNNNLTASFSNVTIRNGRRSGGSGGLQAEYCSLHIDNVTFHENTSNNSTGGGLNCYECTIEMNKVLFSKNEGSTGGGMRVSRTAVDITNAVFLQNKASTIGGGMHCTQGSASSFVNVDFIENQGSSGGGLYSAHQHFVAPSLHNVNFIGNVASSDGGGMWCGIASPSSFSNVVFRGNEAGTSGGGLRVTHSSDLTMVNMVFAGNKSNSHGAGLFSASSVSITNATFTGNMCASEPGGGNEGGAMYSANSSPVLRNVIMWNNSSNGSTSLPEASIFRWGSGSPQISHCLIANSGGSDAWVSSIGTNLGVNTDVDPQFWEAIEPGNAPTPTGDFRLMSTSPAIDAGIPDVDLALFPGGPDNPVDVDGMARVYNGIIDLGAYEWDPTLNIASAAQTLDGLRVFPNPATDWLLIEHQSNIDRVVVYQLSGKMVLQHAEHTNAYKLDVSNLSQGIYIVKVYSGMDVGVYKVVKY